MNFFDDNITKKSDTSTADNKGSRDIDIMQSFGIDSAVDTGNTKNDSTIAINTRISVDTVDCVDIQTVCIDNSDFTNASNDISRGLNNGVVNDNSTINANQVDGFYTTTDNTPCRKKKINRFFQHCIKAGAIMLSKYQVNHLYNNFEKGHLVQSGDFYYLLYKDQLMAYKYSGSSMDIVIPDKVGNVAVTAVYRGLLHKTLFNNHKVRGIRKYFSEDVEDLSVDNILECYKGVKSIQLPKYLKTVPDLFAGCQRLRSLVIPENVKMISPDLIKHSKISELYFDGEVPQNLRFLRNKTCKIYCRPEYSVWYKQALRR